MVLNYIWITFFLAGFIVALYRLLFTGDTEIFSQVMQGIFSDAKNGFEISIGLTGVLALWLGFMKIGEKGGVITVLAKLIAPFFRKIFPEIPKNHPVYGTIMLNIAANMLGLDNAATPMGLKAMDEMQKFNKQKDTASNAQIMFLVLNTSGLTLIPTTIMVYRAQAGAADPTDIFLPILFATFFSTIIGFLAVAIVQKINIFNKTILLYLGSITALLVGLLFYLKSLPGDELGTISSVLSNLILFSIIISFIVAGIIKRVNVFDAFIEGAKDGFNVAIKIIPNLIAILVGIGIFRTVGGLDLICDGLAWCFQAIGVDTEFVPALPTALMKPLSGSGARGMMIDAMNTFGADSFAGKLACIFQGSTDTTFYIIAVYFGSVGIRKTRHAISCGLIADFAGIVAAILIAYLL
ncbi:MAG: spore maturation protein [Bacteroidales bacterium]|nr:spore maturation protein [Bacteroidales bacterium]